MATAAAVKDEATAHRFAKDHLKAFIERVERLEEEKKALSDDIREKIALFADVDAQAVIGCPDVPDVYFVPEVLQAEGLDALVCGKLGLDCRAAELGEWQELVDRSRELEGEVTLNLTMSGQIEDDGTGKVRRKAGSTTIMGTAKSGGDEKAVAEAQEALDARRAWRDQLAQTAAELD